MSFRHLCRQLAAITLFIFVSSTSWAGVVSYAQDFEAVNAADPAALGPFGEDFKVFGDVWGKPGGNSDALVGVDSFLYSYGPFAAPNGGPAFSAVAGGEGGAAQGTQYLNIYSDYNNADQNTGGACGPTQSCTINTSVFRESVIDAGDIGDTYTLTFDAKSPFAGGIFDAAIDNGGNFTEASTSASAFIKTLDPNAGFATTNDIRIDMTGIGNVDWASFSIFLDLTALALDGQILQFGFNTITTAFDDTGVYYDNVCFDNAGGCPTPAVPVPAAVWLFGSALGLLGVARRRIMT